ncbi:MAG: xylan 1,4-beta-xylosidase, partial [Acidimicrobiaceae bacterium]
GVLHGITSGTAASSVTPLQPKTWRVSAGDTQAYALAKSYGGSITVLLSDPWTVNTGARAPWADWAFYQWWIGAVTDAYVQSGQVPDFWEVQNEPSTDAYTGAAPPTADLVFQQYQIAADAIHARLPGAKVIGPSAGYVTFGSGLGDIDGFLSRASAAGMQPGGISWHEIGASCLGYCDGSPRAVLQHVDDVRAAIAANPSVGSPPLIVNEWGAPWNVLQPGAVVGYLSSLAYAGVQMANPTCWPATYGGSTVDTCFTNPGTLDGLLLPDGKTPTDAWYVERAYAQMTGAGQRLLPSTIADPEASVAATADAGGVLKVLLGRHTGCQTGLDSSCPWWFSYAAAKSVQPVLTVPGAKARYRVLVERIQSVAGASKGSTVLSNKLFTAVNGRIDLGAIPVADGDALLVTLTPA